MLKPGKQQTSGENPWGDGTFEFILKGCEVKLGERVVPGSKDMNNKEPWPQATFGYEDAEGDPLEEKFINLTKGLGLNEKSKFFERIACALGKTTKALTDEGDESQLALDFGPGIGSWDDLVTALESGRSIGANISYAGETIFGKRLQLTLETSPSGWPRVRGSSPVPSTPVKKKPAANGAAPASPF